MTTTLIIASHSSPLIYIIGAILILAAIAVTYWVIRSIKNIPSIFECPQCKGLFTEIYITPSGICLPCSYQNKINQTKPQIFTNPDGSAIEYIQYHHPLPDLPEIYQGVPKMRNAPPPTPNPTPPEKRRYQNLNRQPLQHTNPLLHAQKNRPHDPD